MESILNVKISLKYLVSKWESQRLYTLLKQQALLNMSYIDAIGFFSQI